jgi:hypothetical protein
MERSGIMVDPQGEQIETADANHYGCHQNEDPYPPFAAAIEDICGHNCPIED